MLARRSLATGQDSNLEITWVVAADGRGKLSVNQIPTLESHFSLVYSLSRNDGADGSTFKTVSLSKIVCITDMGGYVTGPCIGGSFLVTPP